MVSAVTGCSGDLADSVDDADGQELQPEDAGSRFDATVPPVDDAGSDASDFPDAVNIPDAGEPDGAGQDGGALDGSGPGEGTQPDATEPDGSEADPTEADPTEADPTEADPTEADPTEADPTEPEPACGDDDGICPQGCTVQEDSDCELDCRDADTWPQAWVDFEDEVVTLTTQRRAQGANCGGVDYPPAGAVAMDAAAREAARCHSMDMVAHNQFDHEGSDGSRFSARMQAAGFSGQPTGENIGAGYVSPASVVEGWMNSEGHCKNIMNASAEVLGIGYVNVRLTPYTADYGHYWTMDLGR